MKKLLFIIPPYFNADDYLNKSRAAILPSFTMPYGILSMESYLSAHCRSAIDLQLLDLNITLQRLVEQRFEGDYSAVFAREIEARLRDFRPQFAGSPRYSTRRTATSRTSSRSARTSIPGSSRWRAVACHPRPTS
jgi:hypothetical protein